MVVQRRRQWWPQVFQTLFWILDCQRGDHWHLHDSFDEEDRLTAEKAGAVEVASSTNGQLTPPVMGAAAFLIAEFTGTPYLSLIRHAFLPALVSYIALLYIVHLEALKLGLEGRPRPPAQTTLLQRIAGVLAGFVGMGLLSMVVYFGFGWLKGVLPELTLGAAALLVADSICF